jgi:hypothetical protein
MAYNFVTKKTYSDCACISGIRFRAILIYYQCCSKLVTATHLNMIVSCEEVWHYGWWHWTRNSVNREWKPSSHDVVKCLSSGIAVPIAVQLSTIRLSVGRPFCVWSAVCALTQDLGSALPQVLPSAFPESLLFTPLFHIYSFITDVKINS